jgi:hypothetical protein
MLSTRSAAKSLYKKVASAHLRELSIERLGAMSAGANKVDIAVKEVHN